eukprot:TRINITY_DN13138_c0_g1_i1.p2 TRINITY_DN13138_c0_g1~~TRINITY_DN13138_c0_g1_i1.p2  ORF type:complete len:374 (+),score=42.47 TRINITY_DN13138_c0_g1_i1:137-1258(+)
MKTFANANHINWKKRFQSIFSASFSVVAENTNLPPIAFHSICAIESPDNSEVFLAIYGGEGKETSKNTEYVYLYIKDLYLLPISKLARSKPYQSRLDFKKIEFSDPPIARAGHVILAHKWPHIYSILGGAYKRIPVWTGVYYDEILEFDIAKESWRKIGIKGATPGGISGHSVTKFGDSLYLFGGRDINNEGATAYRSDLWKFDIADKSWTKISSPKPTPRARAFHVAVGLYGGILVQGGQCHRFGFTEDIWYFDLKTQKWTDLTPKISYPGNNPISLTRANHDAFLHAASQTVWFVGGRCAFSDDIEDQVNHTIFVLDLATLTIIIPKVECSLSGHKGVLIGDVYYSTLGIDNDSGYKNSIHALHLGDAALS